MQLPLYLKGGGEGTSGSSVYESSKEDVLGYNVSCFKLETVLHHYKLMSSELFVKMVS
jgi:hypothetical protein